VPFHQFELSRSKFKVKCESYSRFTVTHIYNNHTHTHTVVFFSVFGGKDTHKRAHIHTEKLKTISFVQQAGAHAAQTVMPTIIIITCIIIIIIINEND